MRVLDELADALHSARGGRLPRVVIPSVALGEQFGGPVTHQRWELLQLGQA